VIIAKSLQYQLSSFSFTDCSIATNVKETLKIIREKTPDFILMDIKLNNHLDGIELSREIAKEYQIPMAYVSGFIDEPTLNRAAATMPVRIFNKPVNVHTIIQMIIEHLELSA